MGRVGNAFNNIANGLNLHDITGLGQGGLVDFKFDTRANAIVTKKGTYMTQDDVDVCRFLLNM